MYRSELCRSSPTADATGRGMVVRLYDQLMALARTSVSSPLPRG
ncbi:hypothetical protein [Streptomyces sp. NPDC002324]